VARLPGLPACNRQTILTSFGLQPKIEICNSIIILRIIKNKTWFLTEDLKYTIATDMEQR
jgi:hypothetical protein